MFEWGWLELYCSEVNFDLHFILNSFVVALALTVSPLHLITELTPAKVLARHHTRTWISSLSYYAKMYKYSTNHARGGSRGGSRYDGCELDIISGRWWGTKDTFPLFELCTECAPLQSRIDNTKHKPQHWTLTTNTKPSWRQSSWLRLRTRLRTNKL